MTTPLRLQAVGLDSANLASAFGNQALTLGGILIPATSASLAPVATSMFSPLAAGMTSPVAANIMSGASGSLSFFRDSPPYERIADWTHSLSKTPTDRWMDVVNGAVRGPNHRWLHHHPLDFAKAWLDQTPADGLRWDDYGRHCFLDSITIKGIPLLPEAVHTKLVELGIPPNVLFEWTHLNMFDVAVGSLSIFGGGTHLFLAITGCFPWQGTETFLLTFGLGTLQIAGGIATNNPLLVVGGALDCAAGGTSYWHHIHIPETSLIETLAPGLFGGLVGGSVITATRMIISWGTTTPKEKMIIASESMGLATLMGTLSAVSPWLSLPLAVTYTAGKLAFKFAQSTDAFWPENPLSSQLTPALCRASLQKAGGNDAVESFEAYLRRQTVLSQPDDFSAMLSAVPNWDTAPKGAEHVFGQRSTVTW